MPSMTTSPPPTSTRRFILRGHLWASYPAALVMMVLITLDKMGRGDFGAAASPLGAWVGWLVGCTVVWALSPLWVLPVLVGLAIAAALDKVALHLPYFAMLGVYVFVFLGIGFIRWRNKPKT